MKKLFLIILFFGLYVLHAEDQNHISKGNQFYKNKKYGEAEGEYRKQLDKDKENATAQYNLGNSLYKQDKTKEAAEKFLDITTKKGDKNTVAQAYHNLGNTYLKNKEYQKSIDAFKSALKNNPKDMDTKYNLEYAKKMMVQEKQQNQQKQNQQNQKNQQNKDQSKNEDKNKDKQNKNDQNKNDQSKNENENKDQNKQDNKKQQNEKQKISKDEAERLLESIRNDEKNLQKDLKKQKKGKANARILKQW